MDQDFARQKQQRDARKRPGIPDTPAAPVTDDDLNPPWDRASGRWPIPPQRATPTPPPARLGMRDDYMEHMEPLVEQSLPNTSLQDFTATGRITALPPLRPGLSWSRGLKAPKAPAGSVSGARVNRAGVEMDEQPSMHIAALKSSTLVRAATIVSIALLISRVFGMLRTILFAATFAYGPKTDAYTLAFTLPDAIFNIVAGGALASAIIPVFNDYMVKKRDRKTAWYIASAALNTSMVLLVVFCLFAIIFTPQVMHLFFGETFVGCAQHKPTCSGPLAIDLTRIMLLQPIFLGGATVAIALLQARQSFMAPALGQVIYTLSIVGGIGATLLDNKTGIFGGHLDIYGPTWGVVVGAVLQLLIQIPGLVRVKMAYTPVINLTHPGVVEIGKLMGPRVLNAAVLYTSVFINRFLLIGAAGVLTGYNTAMTLILLPNGIIGQALAQAAFPTLSTLVSAGEWDRLRQTVLRSIQVIMYLAIPASLGMMVLAKPIATALLDYHNFDPSKLPTVYEPLIFFAIGLTGLALVEILTRAFYALENTRTPTQVSLIQFMFVIGMSILLDPWGGPGIALASSIAWTGEALVLIILLRREMGGFDFKSLSIFTINVLAASVAASLSALLIYMLGEFLLPTGAHSIIETLKLLFRLVAAIIVGGVVYFGFAHFLKIDDVLPLDRLIDRVLRRRR